MGLIFSIASKFRKKTTTKEVLEQLEEDIAKYESTIQRNRELQKSAVVFLLSISFLIYFLAAVVFYLWYLPKKWSHRFLYLIPFLGFPVIIFVLRKLLHFIFVTRITKNARTLEKLKAEKKKILENVMETETYKVAKEILEKFDPRRKLVEKETTSSNVSPENTNIRRRNIPANGTPHSGVMMNSNRMQMTPGLNTPRMIHGPGMRTPIPAQARFATPGMTPRVPNAPILPRDRSFVDKVAEYFIGDGPTSRYALICTQCFSHNGMALMEEFEYIAFKCCYCQHFNPARKQRPNAPKLENERFGQKRSVEETSVSSNESGTAESKDQENQEDRASSNEAEEDDTDENEEVVQKKDEEVEKQEEEIEDRDHDT